jgi:hypothetical protein
VVAVHLRILAVVAPTAPLSLQPFCWTGAEHGVAGEAGRPSNTHGQGGPGTGRCSTSGDPSRPQPKHPGGGVQRAQAASHADGAGLASPRHNDDDPNSGLTEPCVWAVLTAIHLCQFTCDTTLGRQDVQQCQASTAAAATLVSAESHREWAARRLGQPKGQGWKELRPPPKVSHSGACTGSPCLSHGVHGASIGVEGAAPAAQAAGSCPPTAPS